MGVRAAGGRGEEGVRAGLGQRRLARQQAGAGVDRAAQPAGPAGKAGCRIRVCGLPVKAPWLNPIEPKWVHGKRAIVEPDRKLSAGRVAAAGLRLLRVPARTALGKAGGLILH